MSVQNFNPPSCLSLPASDHEIFLCGYPVRRDAYDRNSSVLLLAQVIRLFLRQGRSSSLYDLRLWVLLELLFFYDLDAVDVYAARCHPQVFNSQGWLLPGLLQSLGVCIRFPGILGMGGKKESGQWYLIKVKVPQGSGECSQCKTLASLFL